MMLPVQGVDGTDCCGMGHTDVVALLIRTQRRVELTLRRPSANRAQQQQQQQPQQQQQQQQHEEVDEVAAYASAMYEPRAAAPGAGTFVARTDSDAARLARLSFSCSCSGFVFVF